MKYLTQAELDVMFFHAREARERHELGRMNREITKLLTETQNIVRLD